MAQPKEMLDQMSDQLKRLRVETPDDLRRAWEKGVQSGPSTPVRKGEAKRRLQAIIGADEAKS